GKEKLARSSRSSRRHRGFLAIDQSVEPGFKLCRTKLKKEAECYEGRSCRSYRSSGVAESNDAFGSRMVSCSLASSISVNPSVNSVTSVRAFFLSSKTAECAVECGLAREGSLTASSRTRGLFPGLKPG